MFYMRITLETSLLFYSAFSDLESRHNVYKEVKQQIEKERRRKKKRGKKKKGEGEEKKKNKTTPPLTPPPPPAPSNNNNNNNNTHTNKNKTKTTTTKKHQRLASLPHMSMWYMTWNVYNNNNNNNKMRLVTHQFPSKRNNSRHGSGN